MNDTSIIPVFDNVNTPQGVSTPRIDYLQQFVDSIDFDAPHDGHYDGNCRWIPAAPKPTPAAKQPEPPTWFDGATVSRRDRVAAFLHFTAQPETLITLREAAKELYGSGRSAPGMQKTLQAIAQHTVKANSFSIRYPTTRTLATETAQSHVAVAKHLERLEELGFISILKPETGWKIEVAESYQELRTPAGKDPKQDILLTFSNLGDDMFAVGGAYKFAAARRLGPTALLPSAGPTARLVWVALHDATLTGSDLVEATGLTPGSVRGALQRLLDLRLISVDRTSRKHTYSLVEDAQDRLDGIRPNTITYGNTQRRMEMYARERAKFLDSRLRAAGDEPEKAKTRDAISAQLAKAEKYRGALEAMGLKPAKGFSFDGEAARYQRQQDRDRKDARAIPVVFDVEDAIVPDAPALGLPVSTLPYRTVIDATGQARQAIVYW